MFDTELPNTLETLFNNASGKNKITVGMAYLWSNPQEKAVVEKALSGFKNLKFTMLYLPENVGLGIGRTAAKSHYSGEDYYLQCDSHTLFEKNWDAKLIDIFEEATEYVGSNKVILTAYLNRYKHFGNIRKAYQGLVPRYNYIYKNEFIAEKLPKWGDEPVSRKEKFLPQRKFAANFAFTYGDNSHDIYLPTNFLFWEEEYYHSINLFVRGYAMVYPNCDIPMTHYYSPDIHGDNGRRASIQSAVPQDILARHELMAKQNIIDNILSHPGRKQYEEYAGLKFEIGSDKEKDWIPDRFFFNEEAKNIRTAKPWDLFNDEIGRVSNDVFKKRLEICKSCPHLMKWTNQCKECGCFMDLKAKLPNASCPIHKWGTAEKAK